MGIWGSSPGAPALVTSAAAVILSRKWQLSHLGTSREALCVWLCRQLVLPYMLGFGVLSSPCAYFSGVGRWERLPVLVQPAVRLESLPTAVCVPRWPHQWLFPRACVYLMHACARACGRQRCVWRVCTSVSHVPQGMASDLRVSPSGSGLRMRVLSLQCFRERRSPQC